MSDRVRPAPTATNRTSAPATVTTAGSDDWVVQTADRIEGFVGTLRNRSAVPLTTVARGVVYGLIAGVMLTVVVVLFTIGAVRAVDAYLPEDVWAAHLLTGGIFTLIGLFLWSRRAAKND